MQKRIAVISYHTCPISDEGAEVGGLNIYVLELSKELVRKGYVIDIFTRSQSPKSPKIVQIEKNLRVIHIKAGVEKYFVPKKLLSDIPEFCENMKEFISKEGLSYDILSCHYYLSGIVGASLKKVYKIPLMMTFHTLALLKNLVARGDEERETHDRIQFEQELIIEADVIIATSENDAEYIEALYNCPKEKIAILSPGIDFKLFKPIKKEAAKRYIGAEPKHKIVLFVGRIEPLKGIDVLIYALKILLVKNPKSTLCLWIVGGNVTREINEWSKELQKLEQLRRILQIKTSVKFVGRKKQTDLPYYYAAADVVAMPSHYESFGLTALEAMACGTPVITTDATGVSDIFDKKHHSLITSANNPLMLAEKIQNLVEDDKEHGRISKEVQENVQALSWESVARKFMNLCIAFGK